jgi:hypothetical protein
MRRLRVYELPFYDTRTLVDVPPEPRTPEQLHDGRDLLTRLWSLPSHLRPGEKDAYVGPR